MVDGRKILVLTLDLAGNWPPELALIRSLVDAGHDITVISTANHRSAVVEAGAKFRGYRFAPERDSAAPRAPRTAVEERRQIVAEVLLNPTFSDELLAEVDRQRPDIILVDSLLLLALAACEATGVPTVPLFHTVFWGTATRSLENRPPEMQAAINAHRRSLELAEVSDPFASLAAFAALFAFTYVDLDDPPTRALPNLHFVGPLLRERATAEARLPWRDDDARPLVLVSFSTSFQDQLGVLQRLGDALAPLPARVLLTLGHAIPAGELRLPPNAYALPFVPHAAVLPRTRLVITHAGHGTVIAAATAGVPLLCLPMGRDQFDVSRCAERAGIARVASMDAASTDLREAIVDALGDQRLMESARAFSARQDVEAGRRKALDVIASLARP